MPAYLDHAAAQPLRPGARAAIEAAWDALGGCGANPQAAHAAGRRAANILFSAREAVAAAVGGDAPEVVFTAGGTEADVIAVRGALARAGADARVVISGLEHPAVAASARASGARVDVIRVQPDGGLDLDHAAHVIAASPAPALVSCVAVASETGVISPIRDLVALVRARWGAQVPVHTDAVQALGRLSLDVTDLGVDMVSLAGHKVGGPAASGALWVRRGLALESPITGGGQERGLRSGTQDVALLAGFAAAATEAVSERESLSVRHAALRGRLVEQIAGLDGVEVATSAPAVPAITMLTCAGCSAEPLLLALDAAGVAAAAGSACHTGVARPSPALIAQGLDEARALGSLRVSLGWSSTPDDIDALLGALPDALRAARAFSRVSSGRP